jgi:hypothetical protein
MTIEELHADAMRLREEYHAALRRYVEARCAPVTAPTTGLVAVRSKARIANISLRDRIVAQINGEPVTHTQLSITLGEPKKRVANACRILVDQGRLLRSGRGIVLKSDAD